MATNSSANGSISWTWKEIEWDDWHTILQLVPACLGCLGNLVVIMVLFPGRSLNKSTDILIGHLAVADLLTSVFLLPIPRASTVPPNWLGELYCGLIGTSTCRLICIVTSVYILLAICFDRFIAIVYPLRFSRWVARGRVTSVVVSIWVVSSVGQYTTTFIRLDPSMDDCTLRVSFRYSQLITGSLNFMCLFAIPAVTMLTTHVLIARELLRQSRRFRSGKNFPPSRPSFHLVARRNVLKMTSVVVAVFVVSLGPNQFSYYCYNIGIVSQEYLSGGIHRFTFLLACYNSCVNPFIYASQNKKFREAFINILWRRSQSTSSPIF